MERTEWLKHMRSKSEALYDRISPQYWVSFGLEANETHRLFLQHFLDQLPPGGPVLSAGCGAGRYDRFLLDAGHSVLGIDQSAGMLASARQHVPQASYQKMALQDMDFHEAFDGVICIDALEHVCPEDYSRILLLFSQALKPGGLLYFTMDQEDPGVLSKAFQHAQSLGLPVVLGEVVDRVDLSLERIQALGDAPVPAEIADPAVYHFYPSLDQVRGWIAAAGLLIQEEGDGGGYHHFLTSRKH